MTFGPPLCGLGRDRMRSFRLTPLAIAGVVLLCFGWASMALAQRQEADNFDLLPEGGFNNPFFNHELGPYEFGPTGPPDQGFTNAVAVSDPFAYFLSAGTDFITFNFAEGEFVDYAEVWALSSAFGSSTFHVIGRNASNERLDMIVDSPPNPDGENQWVFVDTSGAAFAIIESIRLSGDAKGFFDDLAVIVVPEPATCIMLGVGLGGLLWMRRRRTS